MTENTLKNRIKSIVYGDNKNTLERKRKTDTEERNCSYEVSYNAIRNWCDAQNKWTSESCLLLANIVFGWMPTAILFHADSGGVSSDIQDEDNGIAIENMASVIAEMLNTNEFIYDQTGASVDVLKHFLKNSYIGASKFLHFIYPHHYAMWDRNVVGAISSIKTISLSVNSLQDFLLYQKTMRLFILENAEKSLREVELLLFKAGQQKLESKQ